MSTPTPNDLTRQQLDELDTLLQRMLNLPLNGAGDADAGSLPPPEPPPVAVPSGPWRVDAPETLAKTPYLAPEAVPLVVPLTTAPKQEAVRLFGPPTSVQRYSAPVSVPGTLRGVDAPALPEGFRSAFAEVPVALDPAARLSETDTASLVARRSSLAVPVHHWPLFGVNWVLEGVLSLGGPFGAVAKHPAMKHLLGGVGVLLLAAAGVWTARGMGWIDIPLPLPR